MSMFKIAIPSRSRPHNQKTLKNISQNFWADTIIVCPESQYSEYRDAIPTQVEIVPFGTSGIGLKRQFILTSEKSGKIIMLDDDLTFWMRVSPAQFVKMRPEDSEKMFLDLALALDKYPMVGITDKFMSQTRPRGHMECQRFNQVLGFNRDLFPVPWPSFRLPHDEEHDIHLQFLTRGHKTAVLTEYSKTHAPDADGGCNDWRNQAMYEETYRLLLEYWPGIVTVVNNRARYRWQEAKRLGGLL